MAATRNKNTYNNYDLEQKQQCSQSNYLLYPHSSSGDPVHPHLPGNGFNPGKLGRNQLMYNSIDTESFLFGIGSTNLTLPNPPCFRPEFKTISSQNLYDKSNTILMPSPLQLNIHERFGLYTK